MERSTSTPSTRLWAGFALYCAALAWNFVMDPGSSDDGTPDGAVHELVAAGPAAVALLLIALVALRRLRPLPESIERSAPDTLIAIGALAQVLSIIVVSITDVAGTYDNAYVSPWMVGLPAMLFGLVWATLRRPVRAWVAVFNLIVFALLILLTLVGFVTDVWMLDWTAVLICVGAIWVWAGLGLARLFGGDSGYHATAR